MNAAVEPCREVEPCSLHARTWHLIRPVAADELPGVLESWAGTFKKSRHAGVIPNHMYDQVAYAAITGLLQRGMRVDVLCARAAPTVVLGWVAHERDKRSEQAVVHYLFVKDGFRQRGYGQLLLDSIGAGEKFIYTFHTPFAKYWPGAYHNPGVARRKEL